MATPIEEKFEGLLEANAKALYLLKALLFQMSDYEGLSHDEIMIGLRLAESELRSASSLAQEG